LRAIAFARIRPGELALAGIQNAPGILKAARYKMNGEPYANNDVSDLAQRIAEWQNTLTGLADSFHHGTPIVDPKKKFDTCKFCQQAVLCRVSELDFSIEPNEEDDAEDEQAVADE
jgi:hypothetical protein